MLEWKVSADAAGQRLDKFLRRALKDVPLSHVYKLLRTRKVRVNGARGRAEQLLGEGDAVVLVRGGHGFQVLEDLEMIEVKQGPYMGEKDKVRFSPAAFVPRVP